MDSLIIDFMKYEKIMENYMKTGTLSLLNNDDFNYTTLLPLFTQFDMKTIIKSPSNVELKNTFQIQLLMIQRVQFYHLMN